MLVPVFIPKESFREFMIAFQIKTAGIHKLESTTHVDGDIMAIFDVKKPKFAISAKDKKKVADKFIELVASIESEI